MTTWPDAVDTTTVSIDMVSAGVVVFTGPGLTSPADDQITDDIREIAGCPTGTGSVVLPRPTTGVTPETWSYQVHARWNDTGSTRRGSLDLAGAGDTVALASLIVWDELAPAPSVSYIPTSQKGADNGVAPLVAGLVPTQYLPASSGGDPAWDDITGKPATFDTTRAKVTDASTLGRTLMAVADAAAARSAIGAGTGNGTSNLALGATSSTAYRGDLGAAQDALITALDTDLSELDDRVTTLEDAPGGGGGTTVVSRRGYVTSGDLAVQNTSDAWALITSGFTLSVPAAAGDEIVFDASFLKQHVSNMFWDFGVIVAGAIVRFGSSGTSSPGFEGDPGQYPDSSTFRQWGSLGMAFLAEAGDISGGNVNIAVVVRSVSTGGKLYASANYPFRYRLANYGPQS